MTSTRRSPDKSNEVNPFTVLMNWCRDGNLKSEFPKDLEKSKALSLVYFLNYFVASPKYWIYINDTFNNAEAFKLDVKTLFKTFKEIIYFTGYTYFNKKKAEVKENEIINLLKKKFPYYKKEEICMVVDIIDNSEDKDVIYEQFGLFSTPKAKKMKKNEIAERSNKIKNIISSDELLGMI